MGQSKNKRTTIPVHKLSDHTALGIKLHYFERFDKAEMRYFEAHRDDYYVFILQECGYSEAIIDFKSVKINGSAVFFILPGQVHHVAESENTSGWFMAIDAVHVGKNYHKIFEELVHHQQGIQVSQEKIDQLIKCVELLSDMFDATDQPRMPNPVIHSLVDVYIGMFADLYKCIIAGKGEKSLRPEIITREFRELVCKSFKTLKNPSQYADALSISLSYLNEVVKAVTGFPVSYWIHQEVVLEAKRLLYYSDLSVKQIAFSLGYDDHAYFSRLFSKSCGTSAIRFRKNYRK